MRRQLGLRREEGQSHPVARLALRPLRSRRAGCWPRGSAAARSGVPAWLDAARRASEWRRRTRLPARALAHPPALGLHRPRGSLPRPRRSVRRFAACRPAGLDGHRPVRVLPEPPRRAQVPGDRREEPRPAAAPGPGAGRDPRSAGPDVLQRVAARRHRLRDASPLPVAPEHRFPGVDYDVLADKLPPARISTRWTSTGPGSSPPRTHSWPSGDGGLVLGCGSPRRGSARERNHASLPGAHGVERRLGRRRRRRDPRAARAERRRQDDARPDPGRAADPERRIGGGCGARSGHRRTSLPPADRVRAVRRPNLLPPDLGARESRLLRTPPRPAASGGATTRRCRARGRRSGERRQAARGRVLPRDAEASVVCPGAPDVAGRAPRRRGDARPRSRRRANGAGARRAAGHAKAPPSSG